MVFMLSTKLHTSPISYGPENASLTVDFVEVGRFTLEASDLEPRWNIFLQ